MSKLTHVAKRAQERTLQANAVAAVAMDATGAQQVILMAAANTLAAVSNPRRPAATEIPQPVLVLPDNASLPEMRAARQRRAVRRGQDVYLPSWTDATVGLPNALLRSALFAATSTDRGWLNNADIAVQGDVSLKFTGQALCSYDRKVFAACVDHYREDRPLSSGGAAATWVRISFFQFAQSLGLAYGAGVHRAIRESLLRLNSANLRVRVNRLDVPLPRLVEVAFDDGTAGDDERLLGSDMIAFRLLEQMANLFGPEDWTAVVKPALNDYPGLAGWLAAFYSTHAKPHDLSVEYIYTHCGSNCKTMAEFRRSLKGALTKLQSPATRDELRVAKYQITEKDMLRVQLARWSRKDKPAEEDKPEPEKVKPAKKGLPAETVAAVSTAAVVEPALAVIEDDI